ncbi:MAG TPA: gamma-glutamylcyclotransferase family protein [Candidatus Binataceae bacterium]|nr:gamma-glutamylcyclotransferase family protein [Candidatus Binataceae bacterium]
MSRPDADSDGDLFVYGSLLDPTHRAELIGREVAAVPARIAGYERRRGRYFHIVQRAGVETEGLVLSGLGERDFMVLDRYEEVPRLYTRVKVEVTDAGGMARRCWVYLPTAAALEPKG